MSDWTWVLIDAEGGELRPTETFPSKEEAEAWMGQHWSGLLDEGAEYVSLRSDGQQEYRMGLRES